MSSRQRRRPASGFTLLEVMAVVLLMALLAGIALPALGRDQAADAENDAREIAAGIEFARRSALATRAPFRLVVDIDASRWWLERRNRARAAPDDLAPGELPAWAERGELPLAPPEAERGDFRPVQGLVGRGNVLRDDVFFAGAETSEGWVERGRLELELRPDGSTDAAELVLVTTDGARVRLGIEASSERVRIHREAR